MINIAKVQGTADGFDFDQGIQPVKLCIEPSVIFVAGKHLDPGHILRDEQIDDQRIEKLIMKELAASVVSFRGIRQNFDNRPVPK